MQKTAALRAADFSLFPKNLRGGGVYPRPGAGYHGWAIYCMSNRAKHLKNGLKLLHFTVLLMIQVQILVGGLHRGPLGSTEATNSFFPNNSRLKRAPQMGLVSSCLSYEDASTDAA